MNDGFCRQHGGNGADLHQVTQNKHYFLFAVVLNSERRRRQVELFPFPTKQTLEINMMETLGSCFKGFPPCELDAAIGEGHCLLPLDIYPCVTACTPSVCARLHDGLTASHKFPYSGTSTCRQAQRWKI